MAAPAYCRPKAFEALAREMPQIDSTIGLVRAACAVAAHEKDTLAVDETVDRLDAIVATVRSRTHSQTGNALLAHLHDVLFDVLEYRGNTTDYYSPSNSYLPSVVNIRRGIPITLALIYKYVGAQLGLSVHGVNAPGHFMVAVETTEGNLRSIMFVDPFYHGTMLTLPEAFGRIAQAVGKEIHPDPSLLAPATHRAWLSRILTNLQAVFARSGREKDLYAMQELQFLVEDEEL